MICDTCIHKEVCYEKEEDRRALKHCSDYFNFENELKKVKEEIEHKKFIVLQVLSGCGYYDGLNSALETIDKYIGELK